METLAAVSLAGNILQFLNFTGAAISKTRQIHASIYGTLKEHDDLEGITNDLKDLASRLQASTEPVDWVLEQLCSSCSKVADELLKSLKYLGVKGKPNRSESFRKTLKVLWGKEKLKILEERLAGFRQELTLHLTVELRSSFQALDDATKECAQEILEALSNNRDHLVATTNTQTQQLKIMQTQTETILFQESKLAAEDLAEQSETTRTLTANEQRRTRADVLNAVADAASGCNDAISTQVEITSVRNEAANEKTRTQISEVLEINQEIMRQEINGLQRGLRQIQLEIDRKAEELKQIIIKTISTREGPDRNFLREKGKSATVVLMSLRELYKALEEMLKSLIRQAGTAFGTLFGMRFNHSAIEDRTMFELEANHGPGFDISFPLYEYYAYYYQPLLRPSCSQKPEPGFFSKVKMNKWIHKMRLTPDDSCGSSLEARAFLDLASNRDETLWAMTALVAGLNACLTPKDAILVLSTALSVRYDEWCLLPACGNYSRDRNPFYSPSRINQLDSVIRIQVRRFFEKGSQQMRLQRPRFGIHCTIGKRLVEDYILMSQLAYNCGLQEESSERQPFWPLTERDKADLTLAVVQWTSQSTPWTIKVVNEGEPPIMHRIDLDSNLQFLESASPVVRFLSAIHAVGFRLSSSAEVGNLLPVDWYPSWELEDIDLGTLGHSQQRADYEEQKSKARAGAGQSEDKGKKAVDPERRPDTADGADGRLSDPEPQSWDATWRASLSQILKMYDNPAPLYGPQISDGQPCTIPPRLRRVDGLRSVDRRLAEMSARFEAMM